MKKSTILAAALLAAAQVQAAAMPLPPLPPAPPVPLHVSTMPEASRGGFQLYFQQIELGNLITLAYSDVIKKSFALDSSLASRHDLVSVVFQSKRPGDILPVLQILVEGVGGEVVHKNGIDIYRLKGAEPADEQIYTYVPKYYAADELVQQAQTLIKGRFATQGSGTTPSSLDKAGTGKQETVSLGNSVTQAKNLHTVIFQGSPEEYRKLEKLLAKIDTPRDNYDVDGAIYEVQGLEHNETALGALLKIPNVGFSLGTVNQGANTLSLGYGGLQLAASALKNSSQFKLVSEPHLRVRSGETGTIAVTTQTQVDTGAIVDKNGNEQTTKTYESAGLTFNLTLTGRQDVIDANINANYSDFAQNGTASPDILQRQLNTAFDAKNGETLALGGIREEKHSKTRSGIPFLSFNLGRSNDDTTREFLILLTIHKHTL